MKGGEREHPDAEHRGLLVLKSIGYIIFLEEQTTTLQERRGKSQNFTTSCSFSHVHGLEVFSSMLVSVTALPNVAFHGMGRLGGRRIALLVDTFFQPTAKAHQSSYTLFLCTCRTCPATKANRILYLTEGPPAKIAPIRVFL